MTEQTAEPNRLVHETSPYLQQHAYNPVDWFPWGEEAFEEARRRDVPVFLSVGYSACHWCHVMERESFEDPQIAALMNQWFVNIKVDREERPDVDQIYMTAVQLVTGQGGWPMSVFMTAEGKPFFGGTYWPPVAKMGMIGFTDVLTRIHEYWQQHRDDCLEKGNELVNAIDQMQVEQRTKSVLNEDLLKNAEQRILRAGDLVHGGFGQAPKFPHAADLRLLLRTWRRFGNDEAREFVKLTLDKMAAGGIYDHLAGGFARYSTDRRWLVPHFEKMLYDNAQLVPAYLEGYLATGNESYKQTVRETLDYVIAEMTSPEGGFYSTQDADSEGVEGKFYVWSKSEVEDLLGDDAVLFGAYYDVSEHGNWEESNILNCPHSLEQVAKQFGLTVDEAESTLATCRKTLLEHRNEKRVPPGRDEKVITAWNGLMLSAFSQAAQVLDSETYRDVARRGADFLLTTLRDENGRLWHTFKDGQSRIPGFLDDYACVIDGLVETAFAVDDERYLVAAIELAETLIDQFYDAESQSLTYTPDDHEELIVKIRDQYDNAIPSGTNLAIHALLKLGMVCDREHLTEVAVAALDAVSGTMLHQPSGMCQALIALNHYLGEAADLVCVAVTHDDAERLRDVFYQRFAPLESLFIQVAGEPTWETLATKFAGKEAVDGQSTVYRCVRGRCESPWVGWEAIERGLTS